MIASFCLVAVLSASAADPVPAPPLTEEQITKVRTLVKTHQEEQAKLKAQLEKAQKKLADCYSRYELKDDDVKVKVTIAGTDIGERLKVCASFPVSALTGLTASFLSGQTLESAVTMRLEQVPMFEEFTEEGGQC